MACAKYDKLFVDHGIWDNTFKKHVFSHRSQPDLDYHVATEHNKCWA
ncbi:uncharacterized protein RCO7_14559 [Rhynchosporium graminicola]|uniref:Uncharacterized protein n=1 Tax=Rhynchosporium graminicola TaxID=2792576 RepID=A0A1E1KNW7_9HELO|nr:uncharacterized protein RCO7_14559 [Rhynchosporium commune]